MNFIVSILDYFLPVGLSSSAADVYYGVGSLALIAILGWLFYKIIRWLF